MPELDKELKNFGFHKIFDSQGKIDLKKYKEAYANLIKTLYKTEIESPRDRSYQEMFVAALENARKLQATYLGFAVEKFNDDREVVDNTFLGGVNYEDLKAIYRREIPVETAIADARAGMQKADKLASMQVSPTRFAALMELNKIHNLRGFWWKVFHPIQNYRENKAISEMKNAIVAGHRGDENEICSGIGCRTDSFDAWVDLPKGVSPLHDFFVKYSKDLHPKTEDEKAILKNQQDAYATKSSNLLKEIQESFLGLKQYEQGVKLMGEEEENQRGIQDSYKAIYSDKTDIRDRANDEARMLEDELNALRGNGNDLDPDDVEYEVNKNPLNNDRSLFVVEEDDEDIYKDYFEAKEEDKMNNVTDIESFARFKGYGDAATKKQLEILYNRFLEERAKGNQNANEAEENNVKSSDDDRQKLDMKEFKNEVFDGDKSVVFDDSESVSEISKGV